jgi:hypothetical protein
MSFVVAECVTAGYNHALAQVQQLITDGGYHYELSMQALVNHGATSAEYDICYVLAAYSVSKEQRGTTKEDMVAKLMEWHQFMFPVISIEREAVITVPPTTPGGEPTQQTVKYVEITIRPFRQGIILDAFGIEPSHQYGEFPITNGQAITNMANALRMTVFGSYMAGLVPPISDAELTAFLANLSISQTRTNIVTSALSLVGRVPYFWGGKSAPGWNNEWKTPKVVTSIGSSSTGMLRPYGLDCSGFTSWVYMTALGVNIGEGSQSQWNNSNPINENQLLPGDLGFRALPSSGGINHVLIYAGKDAGGNHLWVHCTSGFGVVLNSPGSVNYFRRVIGVNLEG